MKLKMFSFTLTLFVGLLAIPVFAQESEPRDRVLTFDNFSLTFHRAIAPNVAITEYAGDPPDQGPGFSDAPHFEIALYNETNLPDSLFDTVVGIRVYSLADLQNYPFLAQQADSLASLLEEQPDLALFETVEASENNDQLPYIPVLPHGQLIRARAHFVETEGVRDIAYITYSNAAREPFMSNYFSYTF